jgi:hypothetical protein
MKATSLLVVALVGFIGLAHAQFDPDYHDGIKRPKEVTKVLPAEEVKHLLPQVKSIQFDITDHDGIKRPKE